MEMALESVNLRGKYQFYLSFIVICFSFTVFLISAGYPYFTLIPNILCQSKIDEMNNQNDYSSCEMTLYCHSPNDFNIKINPDNTIDNLALKYNLYCGRTIFSSLINSLYFIGAVTGVIVCASYPDKVGRLPVLKGLLICNMITQINFLFAMNIYHVLLISFFCGLCTYSNSILSFLIIEKMDETWSAIIMSAKSASYGLVGVFLGFFFLFVNNLFILLVFNLALAVLCYYVSSKYLVESPRWLMSKNRINESIECLKGMAKINGSEEQLNTFLQVNADIIKSATKETTEVKEQRNLIQIFQLKSQQKRLLYLMYIWFFSTLCVYGFYASLNKSKGNIFVTGIMGFTAEVISEMSSGILANLFGRIFMLELLLFMGGASFIVFYFISTSWALLRTLLLFFASFGFNGALNLMYIYTNEILPLSIKALTFGFMYLMSRAGGAVVPIFLRSEMYPVILGALALSCGFLIGTMEETLGRNLEDDVPEAVRTYSAFSSFKMSNEQKMLIQKSFNLGKKNVINQDYFRLGVDDHSELGNKSEK